jgi:hypothetical protein
MLQLQCECLVYIDTVRTRWVSEPLREAATAASVKYPASNHHHLNTLRCSNSGKQQSKLANSPCLLLAYLSFLYQAPPFSIHTAAICNIIGPQDISELSHLQLQKNCAKIMEAFRWTPLGLQSRCCVLAHEPAARWTTQAACDGNEAVPHLASSLWIHCKLESMIFNLLSKPHLQ